MRFAVLGSGSRGNSALVSSSDTRILIDCGFPLREIIKRLARLGLSPAQLDAILVTHEHADPHPWRRTAGAAYQIPVYLSAGTLSGMRRPVHPVELLRAGQRLAIRGLEVQVVGVSHDAREPTQFVLSDGQRRFGMLTDLGVATAEVLECYRAVDALVVEANHDSTMLAGGPYPYFLKARVGGSRGREQPSVRRTGEAAGLGSHAAPGAGPSQRKNNSPQLARQAFVDTLGCDPGWLQVADQHSGLDWREIA
ncbi:MBL fold metallo-hydrolase [Pseudomonas aeruginosa]|nr:MBL fold metallo-hydrolase [Pseudomonas aeruginosa]